MSNAIRIITNTDYIQPMPCEVIYEVEFSNGETCGAIVDLNYSSNVVAEIEDEVVRMACEKFNAMVTTIEDITDCFI